MRQFIKFTIYSLVILVAILWLSVAIFNHNYIQTLAKHTSKIFFKEYTDLELDYEQLSLEIIPLSISMDKISISHPSNLDLLKIEKITANISILSLFIAAPNFDKLQIKNLKSSLRETQLKTILETISKNLSKIPKSKTPNKSSPLFTKIELVESMIQFSTDTPYKNELLDFDLNIDFVKLNFGALDKIGISTRTIFNMSSISKSFFSNAELTLLANYSKERTSIDNLSIISEKNKIISGGSINFKNEKTPLTIELDSNLIKVDFSLLGTFLNIENTYGNLTGKAKSIFKVPNDTKDELSMSITAHANITNAAIYNYKIEECETIAHIDLNGINFEKIILKTSNYTLGSAAGNLLFDDKINFDFELEPEFLPISEILNVVGIDSDIAVDAILSQGSLNIRGAGEPFLLEISGNSNLSLNLGKATAENKIKHETPKYRLNADIQIDTNSMRFGETSILSNSQTNPKQNILKVNGKINFDSRTNLNLDITTKELDLSFFESLTGFGIRGSLDSQIRINQPASNFSAHGSYKIANYAGLGLFFDSIEGDLVVDSKKMQLNKLRILYGKTGRFSFHNVLLDFRKSTLQVQGKAEDVNKFIINKSLDTQLVLNIPKAEFNLKIPINTPQKTTGDFDINLTKIVFKEKVYADQLSIQGLIADSNKKILLKEYQIGKFTSQAEFVTTKSEIKKTTKTNSKDFLWSEWLALIDIAPNDQINFNFKTTQDRLSQENNLSDLPSLKETLASINLDGNLNISCEISGTANQFDGVIKANLSHVSLLGSQWPSFNSTIFFTQENLDGIFSMSGNSLRGRLKISEFLTDPSFNLYLIADRFDLRGLLGPKFSQDPRNYLYTKFDLQLDGPLSNTQDIRGGINIVNIWGGFTQSIGRQRQTINAQLDRSLKFSVQSGALKEINKQPLILFGDRFYFEALLDKISRDSNNIVIKSQIDLSILAQLFPQIEAAQGMIETEAKISGSFEKPIFFAKIKDNKKSTYNAGEWQPVLVSVHDLRPALRNINLDVELDQNSLKILQLKAEKGNGTIDVRGEYFFKDEKSALSNIIIDFFNAKIIYPIAVFKSFEANFTGTTTISGGKAPFKVFGDLVINNARNTADFNLRTEILNALRTRRVTQSTRMEQPIAEFDMTIKSNRSIDILTKNLVATLSSNLILKGDDTNPILLGSMTVDKGKFVYKRTFELLQSSINFDNSVKIDPILDIRAFSDISPYRVYLNISGETSNPLVEFTVDPPYRPDGSPISTMDILLLVSRGKLPDSNRLIGETQESITSEAVNLLAGYIEEPVEKLFEISGQKVVQQIYIDTFVSEETGATGIRLNLPINISKNFDIVFRSESMKSQNSRVGITADYSLHNNISISAGIDDIGEKRQQSETVDGNVDLKFQFAFP